MKGSQFNLFLVLLFCVWYVGLMHHKRQSNWILKTSSWDVPTQRGAIARVKPQNQNSPRFNYDYSHGNSPL